MFGTYAVPLHLILTSHLQNLILVNILGLAYEE